MFKFKTIIFIIFIISFLVGFRLLFFLNPPQSKVVINGQTIFVEIARTPQEKEIGLSGRNSLNQGRGMLFIFDKPGNYTFWMREMKFNLDFVFINGEQVVDLQENIPYPKNGEQPQIINSKALFDKVLEFSSGAIQRLNIKIGDKVGQIW